MKSRLFVSSDDPLGFENQLNKFLTEHPDSIIHVMYSTSYDSYRESIWYSALVLFEEEDHTPTPLKCEPFTGLKGPILLG